MNLPTQAASNLAARRSLTVCILDSDSAQTIHTKNSLERSGFPVIVAANPHDALEKIRLSGCRVILVDSKLSGMDCLTFLGKVVLKNPQTHALLMSGEHSVDAAIDAIKHGAHDFLCKPLDYARLTRTLDDLAAEIQKPQTSGTASPSEPWRPLPLSEMRRIHIRRVLETCNGNRVRAARMLGIGRTSLYRFLKSSDKQSVASASA
jgi:two-component system, response regulator RegA